MTRLIIISCAAALAGATALEAQVDVQRVAATAQGLLQGYTFTRISPLEAKVVKGLPYSAEVVTESVQTLGDGNRIVHRTTGRVYRDSEGRVRREEDRPNAQPSISISDPVSGKGLILDAANRTARETATLPLTHVFTVNEAGSGAVAGGRGRVAVARPVPAPPSTNAQPSSGVVARGGGGGGGARGGGAGVVARSGRDRRTADDQVEETLEQRVIEGVIATGVRKTTTIPKDAIGNEQPIKIVSEEWTSPDLQVLVRTDLTDPRTGRSTYQLLKITRAEPDAVLFQVPPGYTLQRSGGAGGRGRIGN